MGKERKPKVVNKPKKYKAIVKTGDKNTDNTDHFVTYSFNDAKKFAAFLDKKFPNWRWFNMYLKATREQVGNYTKNKRP